MPKSTPHPLTLQLTEWKKKTEAFPMSQHSKFDGFLLDVANAIYDTYEYIIEFDYDVIKGINRKELEKMIVDLERIEKQSTEFLDYLCELDFDSKNMDRVQMGLCNMEDEIPVILKKIKKLKSV